MRILIVHPGPEFSVADVHRGWTKALRAMGHEVHGYNTNDRLMFYYKALIDTGEKDESGHPIVRQALPDVEDVVTAALQGLTHACYTFWPDVVLFISGFFLKAGIIQLLRTRRHKLVMIHTESPYQDEEQADRGAFMDLNILNDPTNLSMYAEDAPTIYLPHAYDPDIHYPRKPGTAIDPALVSDVAFIGTAFPSRVELLEKVDLTGIDFLLGGSDWLKKTTSDSPLRKYLDQDGDPEACVQNTDTADIYRSAKLGLNIYRREAEDAHVGEGWAMGPREVEMAACELPFLRDPRGENEEILPFLPKFRDPAEIGDLLRWWLKHDREREAIARKAREAVADRTFDNHARQMLARLEET